MDSGVICQVAKVRNNSVIVYEKETATENN
jgi:hypothetical protein